MVVSHILMKKLILSALMYQKKMTNEIYTVEQTTKHKQPNKAQIAECWKKKTND